VTPQNVRDALVSGTASNSSNYCLADGERALVPNTYFTFSDLFLPDGNNLSSFVRSEKGFSPQLTDFLISSIQSLQRQLPDDASQRRPGKVYQLMQTLDEGAQGRVVVVRRVGLQLDSSSDQLVLASTGPADKVMKMFHCGIHKVLPRGKLLQVAEWAPEAVEIGRKCML